MMQYDDILLLVVCVFISGILGVGVGYIIRDVQVQEYIRGFDQNIEELNALAGIIRQERKDTD